MENKTHYRKVFKSDHLGVADLEDFIEEKKLKIRLEVFSTKSKQRVVKNKQRKSRETDAIWKNDYRWISQD